MSNDDGTDGAFGLTHLGNLPVTLTFGMVLLGVLILLIILRLVFADVRVGGGS